MNRWTNRNGWWGILHRCLAVSVPAVLIGVVATWTIRGAGGGQAAASLGLGGAVVVGLSALTLALTAWIWDRARDQAVVVSLGAFVAKVVLFGLLLTVVPRPEWIQAVPAGIGALVAILAWQAAEVLAFMHTRQQIYDDAPSR